MASLIRILAIIALVATFGATPASAESKADGVVYTLTNAAAGNRVLVFDRGADGMLTAAGSVATGGNGGALGSQGALAMSPDRRWLYAVNAGSNTISMFSIDHGSALSLTDVVASGGIDPNSVTASGNTVYVLNAGGTPNISGFTRTGSHLAAMPGSTRPLGRSDAGAVQVAIAPSGRVLVVSDKAANSIETFALDEHGVPGAANVFASSGPAPFGFGFGKHNTVIFSEAASIPAGSSSASSYTLTHDGMLKAVSASITTTQGAACWLAVTQNGRWAYTANAASGSLSLFAITKGSGALTLDNATAASGIAHPTDMAFTDNDHMLYVLAAGSIAGYRVGHRGALTWISNTPMAGVAGLVAR